MMLIRVRLGAGLVLPAGNSRVSVSLPENATVADLLDHLRAEYPALTQKINAALPLVSGRPVTLSHRLAEAQEVALLLPAAGGLA
jgi:molybdopterin converting factor small subunit